MDLMEAILGQVSQIRALQLPDHNPVSSAIMMAMSAHSEVICEAQKK
jgi:hypothetical protein